jgi:hypothetical protein
MKQRSGGLRFETRLGKEFARPYLENIPHMLKLFQEWGEGDKGE